MLIAVNHNKYPLRINVGFLIHQPVGTTRDIHFDFEEIRLQPDLDLSELHGLTRVGKTPQGIIVQGKFAGNVQSECVRCLTDFNLPLHTEFQELFAFNTRSTAESELILPEDGNINLEPLVREYLLVEMPIRPLCREDCKGLCPVCGENLNITTCEHSERVSLE